MVLPNNLIPRPEHPASPQQEEPDLALEPMVFQDERDEMEVSGVGVFPGPSSTSRWPSRPQDKIANRIALLTSPRLHEPSAPISTEDLSIKIPPESECSLNSVVCIFYEELETE
jgi:hypothetical protein